MILKRMFFLREQSMTKKSMTFQNAVSPHMGCGERVTRLHQKIAACGIETCMYSNLRLTLQILHQKIAACGIETSISSSMLNILRIAPENCRVRH